MKNFVLVDDFHFFLAMDVDSILLPVFLHLRIMQKIKITWSQLYRLLKDAILWGC